MVGSPETHRVTRIGHISPTQVGQGGENFPDQTIYDETRQDFSL
jgi:hypothetical protein